MNDQCHSRRSDFELNKSVIKQQIHPNRTEL